MLSSSLRQTTAKCLSPLRSWYSPLGASSTTTRSLSSYQIDCRRHLNSARPPRSLMFCLLPIYKTFRSPAAHAITRNCFTHTRMASGPLAQDTKPRDEYRLPTDVKPTHYDLTIRTDLEKLKFDGFVVAQYVLKYIGGVTCSCLLTIVST